MKTLLGTPYTQPTQEEVQALIRQAHAERGLLMRQLLAAAFSRRAPAHGREAIGARDGAAACLRPAA